MIWKKHILRNSALVILVIITAAFFVDGPTVNTENLRKEYVNALLKYDGTRYVWGGENYLGIDCSGLVRKGLIDTYVNETFQNISPQYFRKALYLWYFDASADALLHEYKGYTSLILKDITLNTLNYNDIQVGDIMVTTSGVHTMVYIGNSTWIQADPVKGKVIKEKAPSQSNHYYEVQSVIMRWRVLSETPSGN